VEITELYILWSELNQRKLSPTLASAHNSCPDNATGQLGGNFLIITNVYVDQMLFTILTDSSRNTKNVKIIKIAVENANLCRKNMRYAHCAEICGNMRNMLQSHIHVKLTCLSN